MNKEKIAALTLGVLVALMLDNTIGSLLNPLLAPLKLSYNA